MSVTDSKAIPPIDVLQPDNHGLMCWRPQYDGIEVAAGALGVRLRTYKGGVEVAFNLSPDEAAHISTLLARAAEKLRGVTT